jgi:hypothetical protein
MRPAAALFCQPCVSHSFPTRCSIPICEPCRQFTEATKQCPGVQVGKPRELHTFATPVPLLSLGVPCQGTQFALGFLSLLLQATQLIFEVLAGFLWHHHGPSCSSRYCRTMRV